MKRTAATRWLALPVAFWSACAESRRPTVETSPNENVASVRPIRVLVAQDKTGSAQKTRTPQLQTTDLRPLVDKVVARGGELAICAIREKSNRLFPRLSVYPPPSRPTRNDVGGNPLFRQRELRQYGRRTADYERSRRTWETAVAAKVNGFAAEVESLVGSKADAGKTDVFRAIERAAVFFREPYNAFGTTPVNYLILVTDGLENVSKGPPPVLPDGTTVAVVNGSGSIGSLADLNPVRFESWPAAIAWLDAVEPHEDRTEMTGPRLDGGEDAEP